ncbi:MAG: hypothetical protein AB7O96_14040 [Pseudobdellovibrionaceae bacterium]
MSSFLIFLFSLHLNAFQIPMTVQGDWKILKPTTTPAHDVGFGDFGLRLSVEKSSGAVVLPFSKMHKIKGLQGDARLKGKLRASENLILRLGLVTSEKKDLSSLSKTDGIKFFDIATNSKTNGTVIKTQNDEGDFSFSVDFKKPIEATALWVSAGGEDSKSSYSIQINTLELLE